MKFRKHAAYFFGIIKETFHLMGFNFRSLILFVAVYLGISWIVVTVSTYALSGLALRAAGLYYLGNDNFLRYLRSPVTWFTFIASLFVVGYIQMIQIGGMIRLFYSSRIRKKLPLTETFRSGLDSANLLLIPKNWSVILFMILMVPYLGMFPLTNISFSVAVPGFLREYLMNHRIWTLIYLGSLVIVFVFTIRWMLALHIFVLEKSSFREAKSKSIGLIMHRFLKVVLAAAAAAGIWIVLFIAASAIMNALVIPVARAVYGVSYTEKIGFMRATGNMIVNLINTILTPAFVLAFLSALFGRIEEEDGEIVQVADNGDYRIDPFRGKARIITAVIIIGCAVVYFTQNFTGRSMHTLDYSRPEIVAHKGDSLHAPENTVPAVNLAIEEGLSDWVEIDVRQTADGVIVLSHDDRLRKFTGRNDYLHEMTYEELSWIVDAGGWFSAEYEGTKIPTLQEVLALCKNKVRLMIDLKPTEYDSDLEESVLRLIQEAGMRDQCVIASLRASSLQKVKTLDPEMTVVYCMAAANGNISKIPYADWYSIEESSVTEDLVSEIHQSGKRVYAWTVNTSSHVQGLIDAGIDGILTDDPIMMDYTLLSADYTGGFLKTMRGLIESPNFILQFGF